MIINTHYHSDHTHGNPGFPEGIRVVSTARTLQHLQNRDGDYWQEEAAGLLPNETFRDIKVIRMGGKTVSMVHPGRGHTDGDLVVHFAEDNAIHAGDLFFNKYYPNIDLRRAARSAMDRNARSGVLNCRSRKLSRAMGN